MRPMRLPLWIRGTGIVSIVVSGGVALRLVWEQTVLTWGAGPQIIGFALVDGRLAPLMAGPVVMLLWLVIIVAAALVGVLHRRRLTADLWGHLAGILFVAALLDVRYGTWQWLFASKLAVSSHRGSFLVEAAGRGDMRLVRTLIARGVSVDARGPDGQSALQAAALRDHVEMLDLLLQEGADIDGVDRMGNSALEKAASRGTVTAVRFLESRGAHRNRGQVSRPTTRTTRRAPSPRIDTEGPGATGVAVSLLQAGLNAQLRPAMSVRVDGVYGPDTVECVRRFQAAKGIPADGVVGPATWHALFAPPLLVDVTLGRVLDQLGSIDDFVGYVEATESRVPAAELFDLLWQFVQTEGGARYLLIRREPYILDVQHFFAAAAEAADASVSRWGNLPIGGGVGWTLLLGMASELVQCAGVAVHSCFQREDLASNRFGADFGRSVAHDLADGRATPVSRQLRRYLEGLGPQAPVGIVATTLPGAMHVVREGALAFTAGLLDVMRPGQF
jgi:hypothetical protein